MPHDIPGCLELLCVFVAVVLQPAQLATWSVWQGAFMTFVVERELVQAVERHVLRVMRNVLRVDAVVNLLVRRDGSADLVSGRGNRRLPSSTGGS